MTGSSLGYHRTVVEGMMDARERFEEVEAFINEAAALDQDEKAALWLLAWSLREGWAQGHEAAAIPSSRGAKLRPDSGVMATSRRRYGKHFRRLGSGKEA